MDKIQSNQKDFDKKLKNSKINSPIHTTSDISIKPLYTPLDINELDYPEDLNFPGEHPYTRGIYPSMYRGKLWTMRQYAGYGDATETNKRFHYLLKNGQTGLSVAFDLPTQIGYDSDNPKIKGEVGRTGVAISSLEDMEKLFNDIPLDQVSTSMTINSPAAILLAMYSVVGEKQGLSISKLKGTIQNDILKEYVARGTYIFPPHASMRIIADTFEYCSQYMPNWNTISIGGYHIREAGATAVQEIAFTLSNAITYLDFALDKKIKIDDFAPRLSFFFCVDNDLFEEIAKFRAVRRLWAKIIKNRYNAKKPESSKLRFHTQTSGFTLTAQQPENNIVRVTIQALASILGGSQSLHTDSFDEALGLPSEKAVKIALRTQQILAHENGVANTIDPLGGSYYVEWLTNELENKAMKYIEKIDSMGGMLKAIEKNYVQKEITKSALQYQREVESNDRLIVGLNSYKEEDIAEPPLFKLKDIENTRITQLSKFKKSRDSIKLKNALQSLQKTAKNENNLIFPIFDCVKSQVTLGEICDELRDVFGEYSPEVTL